MKIIFALLAVITISSCATHSAPRSLVNDFHHANFAKVESGQMKWSDYYLGIYENIKSQPSPTSGSQMLVVNGMIDSALEYETGKIDKDAFMSKRRSANAELTQIDADYQTKLVEIQASRPTPEPYAYRPYIRDTRPALETFKAPRQTNCSTYSNQTSCTTY
ncbi:MAG: hypothetical protein CTY33_00205 [Methylotenera sp.]|nr:MAG: hypothetical protein CTY33_00205 [Methylotenera sp.]